MSRYKFQVSNNHQINLSTDEFQPTYLYIKRHPITGKLYFGKTMGSEKYLLEEYNGSGEYWEDHLRIHGDEDIETIWYCLFTEKEELVKFALMCSEFMDIVKAKDNNGKKIWANLMYENGITGVPKGTGKGRKQSAKTIEKRVEKLIGLKRDTKFCENASIRNKGKAAAIDALTHKKLGKVSITDIRWTTGEIVSPTKGTIKGPLSTDHRKNVSKSLKGLKYLPQKKVICPYCHKEGGASNMQRYHFENCKLQLGELA